MKNLLLSFSGLFFLLSASVSGESLVERLGYPEDSRLLIVNCDDVGMCHSANMAAVEGQKKGMISSGTIMVPCPWFPEIVRYAKRHPELCFGVHLTLTSEWNGYRWGPVAPDNLVPGLLDHEGYLWRNLPAVYRNSSPEEAYIEARAQIEKFKASGLEPTHIDSHMFSLTMSPEYFEIYARLALEYDIPLRMASQKTLERYGFPDLRKQTAAQGLVFPDYFVYGVLGPDYRDKVEDTWVRILSNLKPGVTEIYIHASTPAEEMKAAINSWQTRVEEYNTFTGSTRLRQLFDEQNIKLISYQPLKELQQRTRYESKNRE